MWYSKVCFWVFHYLFGWIKDTRCQTQNVNHLVFRCFPYWSAAYEIEKKLWHTSPENYLWQKTVFSGRFIQQFSNIFKHFPFLMQSFLQSSGIALFLLYSKGQTSSDLKLLTCSFSSPVMVIILHHKESPHSLQFILKAASLSADLWKN